MKVLILSTVARASAGNSSGRPCSWLTAAMTLVIVARRPSASSGGRASDLNEGFDPLHRRARIGRQFLRTSVFLADGRDDPRDRRPPSICIIGGQSFRSE